LAGHEQLTPRMQACVVRFGANEPFEHAAGEMAFHYELTLSKECVRRNTLEAGTVYAQLQADTATRNTLSIQAPSRRQMMSVDAAKILTITGEWRDVKTLTIAEVTPSGHTQHNSYFSRLSEVSVFAQQCQIEVRRRGLKRSAHVCAVNDGADWIPEVVTACRPDALRILDFYHAAEHLADAARTVFGEGTPEFQAWFEAQRRALRDDDPDDVLDALAALAEQHPQHAEAINAEQGYFLKRRDLIDYAHFKAAGWPIGSGPGEAAHKIVVQARMKRAGMRWRADNLDPMLAARNLICNQRWDDDWPLIAAARVRRRARQPVLSAAPNSSGLPPAFKLRPRTPWRDQPVGAARARPTLQKS
jgi:hypothetical protein